jgi:tetratricopeptide (TPR) repeat protein
VALVAFIDGVACADPVADGNAGLAALNRGDNAAAIQLLTRALQSGALAPSDRELAYVRRAQAELASGAKPAALADANQALTLDASDADAIRVRDRATGVVSGPSLADTLNFVMKMMTQQGDVNFVTFNHNTKSMEDATNTFRSSVTHISPDADHCTLYYHYVETRDGTATSDADSGIPLKLLNSIEVLSVVEAKNRAAAMAGTPNVVVSQSSPDVFLVDAIRADGSANFIYFYDQDNANRVAKALTHAMELCGGGSKDVF